jgi:hypothetical protein
MRTLAIFALSFSIAAVANGGSASAPAYLTQQSACDLLKQRVAKLNALTASDTARAGWFCDFTTYKDTRWYLIALRSNRQCEGICSNLVGWYAVDRRNGSVHDFDMARYEVGAKLSK